MRKNRNIVSINTAFAWLMLTFLFIPSAMAQQNNFSPDTAQRTLSRIEKSLTQDKVNLDALDKALQQCADFLEQGEQCLESGDKKLEQIEQSLLTIGPPVKNEAATVSRERQILNRELALIQKRMGECRLLAVKANSLAESLTNLRRRQLSKRLLHRRPNILAVLKKAENDLPAWRTATLNILNGSGEPGPSADKGVGVILATLLVGMGLGFWLRKRLPHPKINNEVTLLRLINSLKLTAASALPWLMPILSATGIVALLDKEITPNLPLTAILFSLSGFAMLYIFFKAILVPDLPAMPLSPSWPAPLRRKLHRRLMALGFITVAIMSFSASLTAELPTEPLLLVHNLLFSLTCLLFLRLAMTISEIPLFSKFGATSRPLVIITLTIIVSIELMGFHNLSFYLGRGLLATLILAVLAWGFNTTICQIFYMLAYGRKAWRQKFGSSQRRSGDAPPSIAWARILTLVLTWFLFAGLLIRIWRISDTFTSALFDFLQEGFKVGDITVVPTRIISGLLLFTVIWTLSSWLRSRMEKEWLKGAQLARSARDAMVTVTGYLGFTLASVFGLAAAGVNFTSLAVIAGALSVGIGFGLQNIVNNFVSGLILLLEQPIKRGDWIRVGETEGYVRKISVRSTIIQTFDRADVIVPNSDLISTPVTNLMLQDRLGRVKVSVGVAYGSDTALVKKLLEEVAANHPLVIVDNTAPAPRAFFLGFGDSSLDFELRCFIRDIDQIFEVRSDLNFNIDAAFRANNVSIPFPQRDLHIIDHQHQSPPTKKGPSGL